MKKQLAFVLGGGGARGALQVGALQALLESGLVPDLLVGTSIGAVNASFIALNGFTQASLEKLAEVWRETAGANLLPANYLWLSVRALFGRPSTYPAQHLRNFYIAHGLDPGLQFKDVRDVRLILVATDLNHGRPVLFGQSPEDSILEGVLASTALPPWVSPLKKDGRLLLDGGPVSTLPIEPALSAGATEIVALDLTDFRDVLVREDGFGPFVGKLIYTVEQRQQELELALASARGVQVTHIHLQADEPVPMWNFQHTETLITRGYELALQAIQERPRSAPRSRWWFFRRPRSNPSTAGPNR